ncbi:hypothetical protein [uncultured Bacteroides sp.]|uniref:hypothetical protein n=1 Tax=uncultured Bacteroides sp. TaxID=162156 RepID=UPI0025991212|nr:hypothetical protein [uncultured Bacteroides sp.]
MPDPRSLFFSAGVHLPFSRVRMTCLEGLPYIYNPTLSPSVKVPLPSSSTSAFTDGISCVSSTKPFLVNASSMNPSSCTETGSSVFMQAGKKKRRKAAAAVNARIAEAALPHINIVI